MGRISLSFFRNCSHLLSCSCSTATVFEAVRYGLAVKVHHRTGVIWPSSNVVGIALRSINAFGLQMINLFASQGRGKYINFGRLLIITCTGPEWLEDAVFTEWYLSTSKYLMWLAWMFSKQRQRVWSPYDLMLMSTAPQEMTWRGSISSHSDQARLWVST